MNNSTYTYLYDGVEHSDISLDYMKNLGMNDQQIESIHRMYAYDIKTNSIKKRMGEYSLHSDPLFSEWQYELAIGNSNASEFEARWINAVMTIKAKYPIGTSINEGVVNE